MSGDGKRQLIGVVHLLPLPGAPRPSPGLNAVADRAIGDARALIDGGVDGLIVENLGDAPFARGAVDAATIASMTRIATAIAAIVPDGVRLGINVLRNDPIAALSIAAATAGVGSGGRFVRINVHVGAMVTDQGLIEGDARATLIERNRLGAGAVGILADVLVKHAVPLGPWALADAARDTAGRGGADGLIVTGSGTGRPTDPEDVRTVAAAAQGVPVWVGSGIVPETIERYDAMDGAIVGTWLHRDGKLDEPLDPRRIERIRALL